MGSSGICALPSKLLVLFLLLAAPALAQRDWAASKKWAYQLQNVNLAELAQSDFDLVVIDSETGWTRAELDKLKRTPAGKRRLVLGYLSIGEAEDYRPYWRAEFRKRKPAWLDSENPHWPGNFKVRYWDAGWQAIVMREVDKRVEQGFDGLYLDIIDAYEHYQAKGRKTAAQDMARFVERIAMRARHQAGADFGIFPQNGEELLAHKSYLAVITGIGREEPYFGYGKTNGKTPESLTRSIERWLDVARRAGKLVLTVDYATQKTVAQAAHLRARQKGYLEYVGVRELDRLVRFPGLQ